MVNQEEQVGIITSYPIPKVESLTEVVLGGIITLQKFSHYY